MVHTERMQTTTGAIGSMSSKPLASVLMITYNHEPYIRKAITGVLSQETLFPFELVIGEDCSADGTREIVLEYAERYPDTVRVITSAHNVGFHKNGLRTFEACRGDYVAFCEGDDCWHDSSKLQTQVTFLITHPTYGLVHSDYDSYYVASGKVRHHEVGHPPLMRDEDAYLELLACKRNILTLTVCGCTTLIAQAWRTNPECTDALDRKSTRVNYSHLVISYA